MTNPDVTQVVLLFKLEQMVSDVELIRSQFIAMRNVLVEEDARMIKKHLSAMMIKLCGEPQLSPTDSGASAVIVSYDPATHGPFVVNKN